MLTINIDADEIKITDEKDEIIHKIDFDDVTIGSLTFVDLAEMAALNEAMKFVIDRGHEEVKLFFL